MVAQDNRGTFLMIGAMIAMILALMFLVTYIVPMMLDNGFVHKIVISNVGDSSVEYTLYLNDELLTNGELPAQSQYIYNLTYKDGNNVLTLFADGVRYEKVYDGGGFGGVGTMPDVVYFVIGG